MSEVCKETEIEPMLKPSSRMIYLSILYLYLIYTETNRTIYNEKQILLKLTC